mmetsp:Transcript_19746/g.66651  ORF Transcript_19746/g.66651 Transcript_19746/m.66651 type:complete len:228 (+) Transcript_19746:550-1233(+)
MAKRRGHSLPVTSRRPVGSSYASPLSTASCCSAGVRPRLRRSSAVSSPRRSTKQRTAPLRGSMTASRSSCHRLAQTSPRTHCSSFRLGSGRPAACTAMRRLTRNECASSSCKMSEPSETKRLPAPSPVMPHPSEMPDGSATVSRSFSVRASRTSSSPSRHSSWMQRPACMVTPSPNQAPGRRSQWSSRPLSTSTRRTVDSPYRPVLSMSVPSSSRCRPCVKASASCG